MKSLSKLGGEINGVEARGVLQKKFGHVHPIERGCLYEVGIKIHGLVWCNQGQRDEESWLLLRYFAIGVVFMGFVSP